MKKIIILLLCCFMSISCRTMPKFTGSELSEYFDLCMALDKVDFTYGKKYSENPLALKLYKVTHEPFGVKELYFSIEPYLLTRKKIKAVQKAKKEIYIIFVSSISGWCKAIVYMPEEDAYLIRRAEVLIKLSENLYYFEGES